ncbi:MAG: O-antigen ligase family protein [Chloroflexota bacterium]|nr:O-antigen ligase family protein [Chloroflexota bacterium]
MNTSRPLRSFLGGTSAVVVGLLALGLVAVAMLLVRASSAAFVLFVAELLAILALATLRWPRAMLVVVVLAPILDRFVIAPLISPQIGSVAQFFSEALLALVGTVLLVVGLRDRRVLPAVRHPGTIALAAFVALGLVSALINGVPPLPVAAGFFFTLDAVAVFYLCRVVGFSHRQAVLAIGAVGAAVMLLAFISLGQGVLGPDILGLDAVKGRSGEAARIGSVVRNPNALGSLIALILPFTLFGSIRLPSVRMRWAMAAAALLLAMSLLLTYSRGSWLGVVIGTVAITLFLDRKVLLAAIGVGALAFVLVNVMPRDLLVASTPGVLRPPSDFNIIDTTTERVDKVSGGRDLRTLLVLNAIPILRDHLLLGVGPGRYGGAVAAHFPSPVYLRYGTDKLLRFQFQQTVDNFWLHLLIEAGILGAAAFIALIGLAAARLVKAVRRAVESRYVMIAGVLVATVAMSVIAGTTMSLEGNTAAFMFWFVLGVGSLYGAEPQPA